MLILDLTCFERQGVGLIIGYLTDTNFDEVANIGLNDDGQSSDEDDEGANTCIEDDEDVYCNIQYSGIDGLVQVCLIKR